LFIRDLTSFARAWQCNMHVRFCIVAWPRATSRCRPNRKSIHRRHLAW
jgi:hypothetical protein